MTPDMIDATKYMPAFIKEPCSKSITKSIENAENVVREPQRPTVIITWYACPGVHINANISIATPRINEPIAVSYTHLTLPTKA